MKKVLAIFFIMLSLSVFFSPVYSYAFVCVDGSTINLAEDFQNALDSAALGVDSDVRLVSSVMSFDIDNKITSPGTEFVYFGDLSVSISGGWNAGCTSQTNNPSLTVLEGGTNHGNNGGVLSITINENPSSASVSISNLTVKGGITDGNGGGLFFDHIETVTAASAILDIRDVIIESNKTDSYGGGISIFNSTNPGILTVNISDCTIKNNTYIVPISAGGGPGGISIIDWYGAGTEVSISRCKLISNSADNSGGALYIDTENKNAIIVNNLIAGNTVEDDSGGGVYLENSSTGGYTVTNNTIVGNRSNGTTAGFDDGGGLYAFVDSNTLNLFNNIIYNNSAQTGSDISIINKSSTTGKINNNDFDTSLNGIYIDVPGYITQVNNLPNIDPMFVNASGGDYHLSAGSQVINRGDNNAPSVPSTDLDGIIRPQNERVDMGAYEYAFGSDGGGDGGGGCFIATAAYGSYLHDDVMVLRKFRDKYLLSNVIGRAFVNLYYKYSPPVAHYVARHKALRTATRIVLTPLVYAIKYPFAVGFAIVFSGLFFINGIYWEI